MPGSKGTRHRDGAKRHPRGMQSLPQRIHPRGLSLIELLIAVFLGTVMSVAAIQLLASTSGAATSVLQSIRLSQDLRGAMQIMTRDIRRAGYSASAMWCLGNTVCLPDATVDLPVDATLPLTGSFTLPAGISINADNDCFTFELDRDQDGTVTDEEHGAYRLSVRAGTGLLEMWTGQSAPDCDANSNLWAPLTDPNVVDVTEFSVDDDASFSEVVAVDLLGNTTTQRVRRVRLQLQGQLIADANFTQRLEDIIDVRNDILL